MSAAPPGGPEHRCSPTDPTDPANPVDLAATRNERSVQLLEQAALCPDPVERASLHEEVFLLNSSLAVHFARRYQGRGVDWDDLLQVAYVGLVKAIQGFRPQEGAGFTAYAAPTITGEIKRHFRDHVWTVRPPRRMQELQAAVRRAEADLLQSLGRTPTTEEVAGELGVDLADVDEARTTEGAMAPLSLDAPVGDGSSTLGDLVADVDDVFDRVDQHESLVPVLADLDEREQQVLLLRFVYRYTQDRIGVEIGVSQMQVSRLLRGILRKLRQRLDTGSEVSLG
ncbi:sigma-70 family RNA polymerase sigma factor [Oryzihumus sp.]|uniref:sigma-70 family RNA polymerase sigma factor n=1 Tax=Oryzihumus sp. TaxID=1968903 RepID=UPI002ED7DA36